MWKEKSSSARGGGGDTGRIAGIVQEPITVDGFIIGVFRNGTEGYLVTGGITIETTGGTGDPGIIIPFLTVTWIGIGEAAIGERKEENIAVDRSAVPVDTAVTRRGTKDN